LNLEGLCLYKPSHLWQGKSSCDKHVSQLLLMVSMAILYLDDHPCIDPLFRHDHEGVASRWQCIIASGISRACFGAYPAFRKCMCILVHVPMTLSMLPMAVGYNFSY
jgi:hypothetical protein